MSSGGELTKGGPPDWCLNEETKPPHCKRNQHFAKYYKGASDLDRYFGMT